MTHKQRFYITTLISAFTWMVTLVYIFGYNVYSLNETGAWILREPPRALVMVATMIAMSVSFAAWRWYKQDRVDQALSGLNVDEMRELRTRLEQADKVTMHDDDDYEVVLSPRKRKLSEEE